MLTKNCTLCRKEFETDNMQKLYCSSQCRSRFHNQKSSMAEEMKIICVGCGKEFIAPAFAAKRRKYCEQNCLKRHSYQLKKKAEGKKCRIHKSYKSRIKKSGSTVKICEFCKKAFAPQYAQSEMQKFCDTKCKIEALKQTRKDERELVRNNTIRQCPTCNSNFTPKVTLKEFYCSFNCRVAMNKKIYSMMERCYKATATEKANHSDEVLGYSPNQLLEHLQSFAKWDELKKSSWHLDHIFPIAAFLRHGIKDISVICCLENLQPLAGVENLQKNDDYNEQEFENWVAEKLNSRKNFTPSSEIHEHEHKIN